MASSKTKVTVGVTGGIAAYKAVELVRLLQDAGLDVHVVMTESATQFVQPLTFAAISGHKVITGLWSEEAGTGSSTDESEASSVEHVQEAQTTRLLVVAPATANTLARMAHGLTDDFLSTMYLATTAPVIVAPAMNVNMWEHAATQANVTTLKARGVRVIEPGSGYLACGMVGGGRLADPELIASVVLETLHAAMDAVKDMAGQTVLITAGGTREAIDPVRFIGNRSSGRMGYALAEEARRRGARVVLVSAAALDCPEGVELVPVVSAAQMREAVMVHLPEATMVVMAAAVSDYRVKQVAEQKIRRDGSQPMMLELEATEDILREVVERRPEGCFVVGFAAETEDALASGRRKMERKGVDALVVNDVSVAGLGFDAERNAGSFLTQDGSVEIPAMTKREMAQRIFDLAAATRAAKHSAGLSR